MEFGVEGSGLGLRFWVKGFKCEVDGFEVGVWRLDFRVGMKGVRFGV